MKNKKPSHYDEITWVLRQKRNFSKKRQLYFIRSLHH